MLVHEIPRDKTKYCIEKLYTIFDPSKEQDLNMIRTALSLYRNGTVYNAAIHGDSIHASVLDKDNVHKVELEMDFIEISYCDCGEANDVFCTHKLAVLFYVFSLFDSPGEFFNQWKAEKKAPIPPKGSSRRNQPTLFNSTEDLPYVVDSLDSWIQYFNKLYDNFKKKQHAKKSVYWSYNYESNQVSAIFEEFYPIILDAPRPPSSLGKLLFHIHAAVTVVEKIFESSNDSYRSIYAIQNIRKYLNELINEMTQLLHDINNKKYTPTKVDEEIIHETPERMMNFLVITRDFQYERFYLFQLLCSNLGQPSMWINQLERKFNTQLKKEEKLKQIGKVNFSSEYRLVLAHFSFLTNDDQGAITTLRDGDSSEIYYCTSWIKSLAQKKLWNRFEVWLPFIEERMSEYNRQYGDQQLKRQLAHFYLLSIKEYSEAKGSESIYLNTLQAWLPYSYNDFSNYLLGAQTYRKWVELHLFSGFSIEHIDRDLLKKIEVEDRISLLPLYHNAVEDFIMHKNRESYRQAVKYLRKLKAHYRALKKETVWDEYIHMLASKYKRLRAFQEELRKGKGKLIDD